MSFKNTVINIVKNVIQITESYLKSNGPLVFIKKSPLCVENVRVALTINTSNFWFLIFIKVYPIDLKKLPDGIDVFINNSPN